MSFRAGSSLLRRNLSSTSKSFQKSVSADLYLRPQEWKGLPSEQIFKLFEERTAKLGGNWKANQHELEALLSTSQETGVSAAEIRAVYQGGEQAAYARQGVSLENDYKPKPFKFDDYPSQAHLLVHQHREQRHYNRLAAYELPLLAQYRQEYKKPTTAEKPITYRYTTYIGEEHPAAKKVVLTVKTKDLGLNEKELHKLQLLARTRYDISTDTLKMSCERFPEPAQNARYLNDILNKLIKESKDLSDDFSDIPLDTRHVKARQLKRSKKIAFPEEWKRPQDAPKTYLNVVEELKKTQ